MSRPERNNICFFSICWIVLLCHMLVLKSIQKPVAETRHNIERYVAAR